MPWENVPTGHLIMTPENPMFSWILNNSFPPNWQQTHDFSGFFVVGTDGMMRPTNEEDFDEYLEGGEYDEVMNSQDLEEETFEINYYRP